MKDRFRFVGLSVYWVLPSFATFYLVSPGFSDFQPSSSICHVGFTEFYWVLLGFTGFYWVLLGFTGFYWVLSSFTGFYWVFTGFYWVLLSFTGFYKASLG